MRRQGKVIGVHQEEELLLTQEANSLRIQRNRALFRSRTPQLL